MENNTVIVEYYPELDIAKGIGISLVVFGHSITQYSVNVSGLWRFCYDFIYSFHMPLFFFISGILLSKILVIRSLDKKKAIHKRFNRLMVPYFFIGFLFIPINYLFAFAKRYPYSINNLFTILIGNNPEGELWFLYVLFVYSSLAILIVNKRNIVYITAVTLFISLLAPYMKSTLESIGLGFSLYQLFPFALGILSGFIQKEKKMIIHRLSMIIVFGLVILTTVYYALGRPGYLKMSLTVLMILIILEISKRISRCDGVLKVVLSALGKYSMDVYILHHSVFVCLRLVFGATGIIAVSRLIFVAVGSITSIILSIGISKVLIRRNGFLRFHVLGEPLMRKTI